MALPLVISTASWTIMQFTDRMFLLWYSQDALAAALPAGMLSFVSICFFLGVASYVNTFVSQYYGAGHPERIGLAVWQGVWLGVITIPLVGISIPLAPAIFDAVGHGPAIAEAEVIYYQILSVGAPALVIAAAQSSFFTGRGKVRTVMVIDTSTALLNVALDYVWIFGYAGFPEGGIAGAAWATTVAQWAKIPVYGYLMLDRSHRQQFGTITGFRWDGALMARLLKYGMPNGIQFALEVGAFTAFVLLVGRLGVLELAATNLAININTLAFMPIYGIGIATTTMVGQRLGENRPDLAARATWSTFTIATIYTLAVSVLYVATPGMFLWIHEANADGESFETLRSLTIVLLRWVAAYCLLDMANVIFVSAIKGAGDTRFVLITSFWASLTMFGLCYVGLNYLGWGVQGAWAALTIWIFLLGIAYFVRFWQGKWRSMRVIEKSYLPGLEEQPSQEEAPMLVP
jgi:MATE family multidrug resistance protein